MAWFKKKKTHPNLLRIKEVINGALTHAEDAFEASQVNLDIRKTSKNINVVEDVVSQEKKNMELTKKMLAQNLHDIAKQIENNEI